MKLVYSFVATVILLGTLCAYGSGNNTEVPKNKDYLAISRGTQLLITNIEYYEQLSKRHPKVTNRILYTLLLSEGSPITAAQDKQERKSLKNAVKALLFSPYPLSNGPIEEYLKIEEGTGVLIMNFSQYTALSVHDREFTNRLLFKAFFSNESDSSSDDESGDDIPYNEPLPEP